MPRMLKSLHFCKLGKNAAEDNLKMYIIISNQDERNTNCVHWHSNKKKTTINQV